MKNIDNDFQEKKSNFMCRFQDRKKNILETEWKTKENSKTVKTIFVKQSDTTNLWNQINKKKKNLNGKKKSPRKKEMICEIKWGKKLQVKKKN